MYVCKINKENEFFNKRDMRIYIKLTKNRNPIPFNYQELLTGVIHKWIGKDNDIHGRPNVFSFSWLQNTTSSKQGLDLNGNTYFFIGSKDEHVIRRILAGIMKDPTLFNGIVVKDVQMANAPHFESPVKFIMASPVLLKIKEGEKTKHITIEDKEFEAVLTENLKSKLKHAGISEANLKVKLDSEGTYRKTKMVNYKGIHNKASFTPIIIEGSQEQIAYAWNVGIGNSTGIGFGALK